MENSQKYRRFVRECLEIAETMDDPQARAVMVQMAHLWFRLAEQHAKSPIWGARPWSVTSSGHPHAHQQDVEPPVAAGRPRLMKGTEKPEEKPRETARGQALSLQLCVRPSARGLGGAGPRSAGGRVG
jgi:hypothetical protein